jgi:hypothetical protein
MKTLKSFNKFFESIEDLLEPGEQEWCAQFPPLTPNYSAPKGQLYRWITPGNLDEYLEKPDIEESGDKDIGYDQYGNHTQELTDIPFFITSQQFFGYVEPFVRIILDKKKLLDDGYVLYNPDRDKGERRIVGPIKNWLQYLIFFEVYRDEFVLEYNDEFDEWDREIPIPFFARKKYWEDIKRIIPNDKIVLVDEAWHMKNVPYYGNTKQF